MFGSDKIYPFPTKKLESKKSPLASPSDARTEKPLLVLDMGEASREEGFRLNGCR